jgi:antitoxin (DNA-binding transcriptional repressor) of toxin-antitoxin stability system
MKLSARWLYGVAAIAAVLIAVSAIVQSVRQGSWSPILSVGWLAAVIVAVASPRATRRCLRIRRRQPR